MTFSLLLAVTLASAVGGSEQVLPATTISHAVMTGVRGRLATEGSTAKVEVVGRLRDQPLPAGEVTVELGDIAGRWPRGRVGVPVQLLVDDRPVRSMTVWVEMHDEREVLVYADSYPAHTPGGDIRLQSAIVDMVCCAGPRLVSADRLEGRRLAQTVSVGTPVLREHLEALPDVRAQSEVAIVVQRGPIRIVASGIALGDGEVGDVISVRPDRSRVAIQSRVVAEQKVLVDE